jgi:hypothetical protein
MTDSVYGVCDGVLSDLQGVFENFRIYIEKEFPKVKALAVEFKY